MRGELASRLPDVGHRGVRVFEDAVGLVADALEVKFQDLRGEIDDQLVDLGDKLADVDGGKLVDPHRDRLENLLDLVLELQEVLSDLRSYWKNKSKSR